MGGYWEGLEGGGGFGLGDWGLFHWLMFDWSVGLRLWTLTLLHHLIPRMQHRKRLLLGIPNLNNIIDRQPLDQLPLIKPILNEHLDPRIVHPLAQPIDEPGEQFLVFFFIVFLHLLQNSKDDTQYQY